MLIKKCLTVSTGCFSLSCRDETGKQKVWRKIIELAARHSHISLSLHRGKGLLQLMVEKIDSGTQTEYREVKSGHLQSNCSSMSPLLETKLKIFTERRRFILAPVQQPDCSAELTSSVDCQQTEAEEKCSLLHDDREPESLTAHAQCVLLSANVS